MDRGGLPLNMALGTILGTSNATATPTDGSVTSAKLASAVIQFPRTVAGTIVTLTDGVTVAWDMSLGNDAEVALGGNRTLGVPTSGTAGQSGTLSVYQDATGSRTLAYSWCYAFTTALTLSTAGTTVDKLSYSVARFQSATVTISNATPGVVTYTTHGLKTGDFIQLTTTGTLPTGLSPSTTYYVTTVDANTFKLSTSKANAAAGTFIATSSAGSGVHTCTCINIYVNAVKGF